jgi:CheY-like chemotaxis protein
MENHDGVVTVYSQPGEGTVFHLYFPAHAGPAAEPAAEEGPVPRGHGERILYVDDEEVLARLGSQTLTALGYRVEAVTQPALAIENVKSDPSRFALVITDYTMPEMNGLQLAHELRRIRPDLILLLTTGYGQSLTPESIRAAGISHLLLKPASTHALGTAVHAALSGLPIARA